MEQKNIHLIAGARPNFMKIAPLYHELNKRWWAKTKIVHTGQHYSASMSDTFFEELSLPVPDYSLGVGGGTHGEQTGKILIAYERVCMEDRPDLVIVVGDVNSTIACALAAVKLGIKVAHLEAGLRSFDRSMPEEINRILTDSISDYLLTPSPDGDENLLAEGISPEKIIRVGNIMIDSFEMLRPIIQEQNNHRHFGLEPGRFGIVTMHRPANVDSPVNLLKIVDGLLEISNETPLIFPVHPRTEKELRTHGLFDRLLLSGRIHVTSPLSYVHFMSLVLNSAFVLTDSGGVQEESTYLGIPCFTLRENTERPVTITVGTNRLVSLDDFVAAVLSGYRGKRVVRRIPDKWDGNTAGRVADAIEAMVGVETEESISSSVHPELLLPM
jgi:UDP-N-acetylglucosamine 2-epimerase (non-hydrolysing)